jgi:trans-aconitate 2-methyltransferase
MDWNPQQYVKFQSAREQPFDDVAGQIRGASSLRIVDLGCGTGTLTKRLADRFTDADVFGLDSSAPMLVEANKLKSPRLVFAQGAIESFADGGVVDGSFDVIFSNAALQWVDGHEVLLPKLIARLTTRGQIAVQLPADDYNSARTIFADVAGWRHQMATLDIADYARILHTAGLVDLSVFEKIYPHILADADAVLEWSKGTALLPYLKRLPPAQHPPFLDAVRKRLHAKYPDKPVFFPFRRIIFYARRA